MRSDVLSRTFCAVSSGPHLLFKYPFAKPDTLVEGADSYDWKLS
jgi:hypothetical protein